MRTLLIFFLVLFQIALYAQDKTTYTLEECIAVAIENNLSVRRARLTLENNKVNYNQSRASQLPNANVNWSLGYNWGRSIDPTTNQFVTQRINSSGLNGNSSVTLFNGLQQYNTVKQGKANIQVSEADLEKAKNDISLNIATFYLNVILNKELVENANYQLQNSNSQLERTKILVESGAAPITNQLELQSQVASNEVALINSQNNLDLALLSLKQAMLLPASSQLDIVVPEITLVGEPDVGMSTQSVFESAESNLPEIKSADLGVQSAALGVKIAQGGMSPTVSFGGGFSTNYSSAFDQRFISDGSTSTQTVPTTLATASGEAIFLTEQVPNGAFEDFQYADQFDENLSWNLGVGVSIPIFNGLRTHSNIQRSKIQLQQAEIVAIEQRNVLRQQIESAYADATAASKSYAASSRQVEALEETFRAVENQYNLGAANFTDYQISSNNLFQAKSDLVRAKYDFVFKKKILDFYQGKPLNLEE